MAIWGEEGRGSREEAGGGPRRGRGELEVSNPDGSQDGDDREGGRDSGAIFCKLSTIDLPKGRWKDGRIFG